MKKIAFISLVSLCYADTFYVVENKGDVVLEVTTIKDEVEVQLLKSNQELIITDYKKVCLQKTEANIEVGIKESAGKTLKNIFPCHDFQIFEKATPKKTFLEKVVLTIKFIKNTLKFSGETALIPLEGKGADIVNVSKSKYPNFELDFSGVNDINIISLFKNDEPIQLSNDLKLSFKEFHIGDNIIIEVYKNGKVLDSDEFEVTP